MRLSKEAVETFRRLRVADSSIHLTVAVATTDSRLLNQMAELGAFTLVKWLLPARELRDVFAALPGSKATAV